jgi:hypothetical protein
MMTAPQTVVVHPAPLTGSERVRRTRERKRKDIVFLGIEILPTERNALIRIGLLDNADRNRKNEIREALCQHAGPDRKSGYWENDEKAFTAWREGDRGRIVAAIRAKRLAHNVGTMIPSIDANGLTNVRRNAFCPCGSGKRYKHCHGAMR